LREVQKEDAEALAAFYGIKYIETSALKGNNVESAFTTITQEVYDKVWKLELSSVTIQLCISTILYSMYIFVCCRLGLVI